MSLREDDQQKKGCSSSGFGLAAAAIGVGVGAALYYFFSKQPENPTGEGSTSRQWRTESPHTLDSSSDSYSTFSANTTTDTSINEDSEISVLDNSNMTDSTNEDSTENSMRDDSVEDNTTFDSSDDFNGSSDHSDSSTSDNSSDNDTGSETGDGSNASLVVDSDEWEASNQFDEIEEWGTTSPHSILADLDDWEVETSMDLPEFELSSSHYLDRLTFNLVRNMTSAIVQTSRERRWSLEECSICFDVILCNQEVMSLPCTHNFHQACILPWLQEQQTCPNCRKNVH